MNQPKNPIVVRGRYASRLAAVQALYQLEQEPGDMVKVIQQFILHRFGDLNNEVTYIKPDTTLMQTIVTEVQYRLEEVDALISSVLLESWKLDRIDSVIRSILRAATIELLGVTEVPAPVIINEYINLTKEYFGGKEVAFVNGSLDNIHKKLPVKAAS